LLQCVKNMTLEYVAECNPKSPDNIWDPARFAVVDQTAPGVSLLASRNNITSCVLLIYFELCDHPMHYNVSPTRNNCRSVPFCPSWSYQTPYGRLLIFRETLSLPSAAQCVFFIYFIGRELLFSGGRRQASLNRSISWKGHRTTPVENEVRDMNHSKIYLL